MACDITRFATLFMNDLSYADKPLGLPADNHGGVAHTYSASTVGNDGHNATGSAASWLPLAKMNRYSFGKVARLLSKLDELGALDSTLIYVSSDMGNPSLHSTRNVPTLLAGGANGKFRMGRASSFHPIALQTTNGARKRPRSRTTSSCFDRAGVRLERRGELRHPARARAHDGHVERDCVGLFGSGASSLTLSQFPKARSSVRGGKGRGASSGP
jgi:hypothetical protein